LAAEWGYRFRRHGEVNTVSGPLVIDREGLDALLSALREAGYETVGPTVRDEVITYDTVESTADLPVGWTDEQAGGSYRLVARDDERLFGYVVGPRAWKRFLAPPRAVVWAGEITAEGIETLAPAPAPRYAFFGVRPCDLVGIEIQDKVAGGPGRVPDSAYLSRREAAFVVVVNCDEPGGTCFCVSMATGPRARDGFDIALTEVEIEGRLRYLVEVGSEAGTEVLAQLDAAPADDGMVTAVDDLLREAGAGMGRTMDTEGLKELLQSNLDHPIWNEIGERCLGCTNCTMVCPTCFCWSTEDTMDLDGTTATRTRRWDSCFTLDFSYIHGGPVRESVGARYRQWFTHKLASWVDQFGTFGCVGCGRCITWCPVGIDLTEEVRRLQSGIEPVAAAIAKPEVRQ
jgi:ferredoxin